MSKDISGYTAKQLTINGCDGFEVVHEEDWIDDGKYQTQRVIVKDTLSGFHYEMFHSRSGSAFSEWHYSVDDYTDDEVITLREVELKEVVKTEWVRI